MNVGNICQAPAESWRLKDGDYPSVRELNSPWRQAVHTVKKNMTIASMEVSTKCCGVSEEELKHWS